MAHSSLRQKIAADKVERQARYAEYDRLFLEAWLAGREAARNCRPLPMVVSNYEGDVLDVVDDGMCGFAWINVPGNTSFGKWLKKTNKARPDYPTGLSVWISDYGQSYERKAAHAGAMATYLQVKGISCVAKSRLD